MKIYDEKLTQIYAIINMGVNAQKPFTTHTINYVDFEPLYK